MKNIFKKKDTKPSALDVIDEQIVVAQQDLAKILNEHGGDSKEYSMAVGNICRLMEQRANMANSEDKAKKIDPNVIIAGGFTVVSSVLTPMLLMIYDEDHVVPKFIKTAATGVKDFLRKD